MRLHAQSTARQRPGYVIFAVLIVVVVLSLVAYRFTDSMTSEYRASVRTHESLHAKHAALSGLHYAAAVLSDPETFYNELGGNPYDNPDIFEQFEVTPAGATTTTKGYFSIRGVSLSDDGGTAQRFGVVDEGGKLNINAMYALNPRNQKEDQLPGQVLRDALMKLPNMTDEVADSILDWIDPDDDPRTSGAESSYYLSLPAPGQYKAKNGPLNSLDELLLVKGVTPDLLYGGDRNRNGVLDEGELDNTRGWSDYMTVYGRELNVDMSGALRFYLNAPLSDPTTMETFTNQFQPAIGDEMAMFLLIYRLYRGSATRLDANGNPTNQDPNQKPRNIQEATLDQVQSAIDRAMQVAPNGERIRSITELINVRIRLPGVEGLPQDTDLVFSSPLNSKSGQEQYLPLLMDKATVQQAIEMVPRINVNTAPPEVLLGIPSITETEVAGIVTMRSQQDPATQATATGAWLVTSGAVAPERFRRLERYITGSSMVYRVQSVGYLNRGGPVARIEAVIDTNQGAPRFLYIRDLSDLDNPRGFQPQPPTE